MTFLPLLAMQNPSIDVEIISVSGNFLFQSSASVRKIVLYLVNIQMSPQSPYLSPFTLSEEYAMHHADVPPISNIMHYYACFLASFIMSFNFNDWCLTIKISAEISSTFISIISCIAPSARQIETSRAVSNIMLQTRALSVDHYQLGLIISQSLIMT